MDKIIIRDLVLEAIIGTMPEERVKKQQIILNIELGCDLSKACESDRLEDTLDYYSLEKEIAEFVVNSEYKLIEALAEAVADLCLKNRGLDSVKVILDKPGALSSARSAAVEIERRRTR